MADPKVDNNQFHIIVCAYGKQWPKNADADTKKNPLNK
jgi:hypothetical protein